MKITKRTPPKKVAEAISHDPYATWLVLAHPYSRPGGVTAHPIVMMLIALGLLEREPTADTPIVRCTERGEEVAQHLLKLFGRQRV